MRGITRTRFEALCQEHGYSVKERQLDIYYSSLGRSCRETFLDVCDGETVKVKFNQHTIERWMTEEMLQCYLNGEPGLL